jgi:hypothetical protein
MLDKLITNPYSLYLSKLIVKTTIFLAAECLMNASGLDTLADYSEFLQDSLNSEILGHTPAFVIQA